ncbi:SIS domain-containing protein [Niallia sp.]|uniref:SIS domain-containing protein n=1 Tax=Niallia sp. TaxID=2837523 RepID=UPI00289C753D|nr:SIS domain-containing protein [Niallia sp.]
MKQIHQEQIGKAVSAVKEIEEIANFYFVGCGGSMAFMKPAAYIFDCEINIPASVYNSGEFNTRLPYGLGSNSVVITCSHSGTTPETVEATKLAREKGAITISLTNEEGSPLWEAAEYPIHYDWGPGTDASDLNKGLLFGLVFHLLNNVAPNEKYNKGIKALDSLDSVIQKTKDSFSARVKDWGKSLKREELIYTMGSGASEGECYSFSICLLMEMQWIHSSYIHSGEYFHGPFEVTDFDVPFILVKGLGRTRSLDERGYNFCTKFSDKVYLIDAEEFDMEGIDQEVQEYYTPLLVGSVLRILADSLAYERGHSLSARRYMWQMEY